MQEVVLDKQIRLLDCPGIVFDDSDGEGTLLRNCLDPDALDDPESAVGAILKRCSTEQLMTHYSLPRFPKGDISAFLGLVARRRGKVMKGGLPDKAAAARQVLRDWNSGKVKYFTKPPADTAHLIPGGAAIVSQFSQAFDPTQMPSGSTTTMDDDDVFMNLPNKDPTTFLSVHSVDMPTGNAAESLLASDDDDDDDASGAMGSDNDEEEEEERVPALIRRPDPLAEDKAANPGMMNDMRRANKVREEAVHVTTTVLAHLFPSARVGEVKEEQEGCASRQERRSHLDGRRGVRLGERARPRLRLVSIQPSASVLYERERGALACFRRAIALGTGEASWATAVCAA
jgi:hypothetical protein